MRRALVSLVITVTTTLVILSGGASAAQPPAPSWAIEVVPFPSRFERGSTYDSIEAGPGYVVQAVNDGGKATTSTFSVTVALPKGLLPVEGFPSKGFYGPPTVGSPSLPLTCSTLGRQITCAGGGEGTVSPGEEVSIVVPVKVEASAPASLVAKAAIEGGGAARVETSTPTPSYPERAEGGPFESTPFGFIEGPGLTGSVVEADGTEARLAGSHPYAMTVAAMNLATEANTPGNSTVLSAGGGLKEATVELPQGVVIDPQATEKCHESELESHGGCPADSQAGTATLKLSIGRGLGGGSSTSALYNVVPPPGYPAEFGFEVVGGSYVHLLGSVSSDGSFTLTASSRDVLQRVAVGGVSVTLWGDPSAESHDRQRGTCLDEPLRPGCPTARTRKALLTLPAACSGSLRTAANIESWLGDSDSEHYDSPSAVEDCGSLQFEPTIESKATTAQADSPSGLTFDLHQPQDEEYEDEGGNPRRETAPLKNTTVALPEGFSLNPSAANGREACTASQVGLATAPGQMPIRWHEEPARCPDSSKVGTARVSTPLIDHELQGSVYLAKPFENPFDSLLAIYLVVEDEQSGIIAKLAGKVEGDVSTGQLRTSFDESPELPIEDIHLNLFDGPRAALTTPLTCGEKTTNSTLTPWSGPQGADAHPTAGFAITAGCFDSEAAAPKSASFTAGTQTPLAGAYSSFVLRLSRPDGSQHITGIETTLPAGLLGKLAGVAYCPESGIAQAISREKPEQGKLEQQSASCPQNSEVGTVNVTAGSGSNPIPVSGHAYLAGPYKGAPLSLVVIVPAVAGPFDLGTVVDRVALNVGEYDARIHAVADPLPTIREGIPLDVRSIELKLDRPSFTLNPTSCEVKAIEGSISTQAGQSQTVSNRFQVGECGRLAFKPKIAISLKGPTRRTGLPALKATVTYPQGGAYANIASAQVSLPKSEFLEQGNIGLACTKPVLAAHGCPAKSIYGKAKAWSPLLAQPLEGPVYLVGGYGYKLPAMVAELDGQIRVLLVGKVDTGSNKGIRSTFEAVPDAPVEKFVLELKGGKKYGLLVNSENVCKRKQVGQASFKAQNGRKKSFSVTIANSCGKARKGGKGNASKNPKHGQGKGHGAKHAKVNAAKK